MSPAPVSLEGTQAVTGWESAWLLSNLSQLVSLGFKKEELTHLAVFSMALL